MAETEVQHKHKHYYRADIDGLRAISIIAVISYHFFEHKIPHGYLGVDVFFVISGFLIAGIIKREMDCGVFSLRNFFKRRIARLFPSLITIFIISITISYLVMSNEEFRSILSQIMYGALYIANFYFYGKEGYFTAEPFENTFLHLWSLSVEEQFYMVFPVLLVGLYMIGKSERILTAFLSILIMASISTLFFYESQPAKFYFPWVRAWEFLFGAMLSMSTFGHISSTPPRKNVAEFLTLVGMLMIIIPMLVNHKFEHPGAITILPVLGAVLVIALAPHSSVMGRILSLPPLTFIGLISYPLYLWHYTLFSLGQYSLDIRLLPKVHGLIFIALSAILAWLTWKYIETPLRRAADRTALPLFASVLGIGIASFFLLQWQVETPLKDELVIKAVKASKDWEFPKGLDKTGSYKIYRSPDKGPIEVLMAGDSHMQQYAPRMILLSRDHPGRTRPYAFATVGGCPLIIGATDLARNRCPRKNARIFDYLEENGASIRVVIIGGAWNRYFLAPGYGIECSGKKLPMHEREGFECAMRHFEQTLDKIRKLAPKAQIHLVLDNPADRRLSPLWHLKTGTGSSPYFSTRLASSLGLIKRQRQPVFTDIIPDERQIRLAHDMQRHLSEMDIGFVDPTPAICRTASADTVEAVRCSPTFTYDDTWFFKYKDGDHINSTFARHMTILDHFVFKESPPPRMENPSRTREIMVKTGERKRPNTEEQDEFPSLE